MLVVVLLALGRAIVTYPGAEFERFAQDLLVGPGAADGELPGRFADVRAIEAGADSLAHVHFLGRAGIGAAQAHARAIHQVMRGIAKWLVDVARDVGVQRDHLSNGHGYSFVPFSVDC
jgi:hypothetical protein